jgi:hypothetical protein
MEPGLRSGDRLLVVRSRRPRRGEIVALRDPRDEGEAGGGRLLVKRVVSTDGEVVVVVGDNRDRSTDSRTFGPVGRRALVGRAVYRYFPAEGAGRLPKWPGPGEPGVVEAGRSRPGAIGVDRERGTIGAVNALDPELTRLFAPDYLKGIKERSLDEVRAMRAECQDVEEVESYLRRVVQGRLDVVHSFLAHTVGDLDSAVSELSSIIGSGPARPSGYGRLPSQMSPDMEKVDLTREIDEVLNAEGIGKLPTMSEDELRAIGDRLTVLEQRISDERRTLHERIDALQAEIVSRYKTGEATVDGLLVPRAPQSDESETT